MGDFSIEPEDYAAWYVMAGEFFKACRAGATPQEVDAGHKALSLGYLGIKKPLTAVQTVGAMAILSLAGKELLRSSEPATST